MKRINEVVERLVTDHAYYPVGNEAAMVEAEARPTRQLKTILLMGNGHLPAWLSQARDFTERIGFGWLS